MSTTRWRCDPIFRPSPGQEDKVLHSNTADRWFYVVGKGFTNGIYTDPDVARSQVHRFSGGVWKKVATWNEARSLWAAFCDRHHRHAPVPVIELSPTPSPSPPGTPAGSSHPSPPPSPSPSPLPPPYETVVPTSRARSRSSASPQASRVQPAAPVSTTSSRPTSTRRATAAPSRATPSNSAAVTQVRSPTGTWQQGDRLYAIAGVPCLFETRYDAVDYVFENSLGWVKFLGSRNRRKVEAFASREAYVGRAGDPEDTD
ncbi:hypothetical protein B0H11DRAFT_2262570 [Mycena galericulata]|nr:hypothetical protein B0H11DRAFT_2262570 [Mycena galericulata]